MRVRYYQIYPNIQDSPHDHIFTLEMLFAIQENMIKSIFA